MDNPDRNWEGGTPRGNWNREREGWSELRPIGPIGRSSEAAGFRAATAVRKAAWASGARDFGAALATAVS